MRLIFEVFFNLVIIFYFIITFVDYKSENKFEKGINGIERWKCAVADSIICSFVVTICLTLISAIILGVCYIIVTAI